MAQDRQGNYVRSGIRGSSRFFGPFTKRIGMEIRLVPRTREGSAFGVLTEHVC
jgi:hypothetical protein